MDDHSHKKCYYLRFIPMLKTFPRWILSRFSRFQRCFPESHCRPKASKLERVSTIQGVRVIEVTEACECTSDSSCSRESFTHLVHSGTPHQAVMDVGVCMGHCAKGILSSFTLYSFLDNR